MSNWQYAGVVPSMTWRGGIDIPRELALQKDADGRPIITSRIVKELMLLQENGKRFRHPIILMQLIIMKMLMSYKLIWILQIMKILH